MSFIVTTSGVIYGAYVQRSVRQAPSLAAPQGHFSDILGLKVVPHHKMVFRSQRPAATVTKLKREQLLKAPVLTMARG